MPISPTKEGFRAAFRWPQFTLAEIAWRWSIGATATALFFFGLYQYLRTLPVTNGELLMLRTRHPYLVSEAIARILHGTMSRVVIAGILAAFLLACLWIIAASLGRMVTVRALLEYFHKGDATNVPANEVENPTSAATELRAQALQTLVRLNFLRAAVGLAAIIGFVGAAILAGFASPDNNPRPGLAFILFLPLAALICLAWSSLNWLLSLAGVFAVRDGEDAMGAISAAVTFVRDRFGRVFSVSAWIGLAHFIAFVALTMLGSTPIGFVAIVPWRLVVAAMILISLAYFAFADWLYMARLAGYVFIAETPEAVLKPPPPLPSPPAPPQPPRSSIQTTIDRDEPILSDVAGFVAN